MMTRTDLGQDDHGTPGPDFVQSLERGLAVILAFDETRPQLTLSEVARVTGLSRPSARRFIHTLVALGYVRASGRYFSLRARVLEIGYSYLSALGLPEIAQPHMEALTASVHESCSLAVLDGDEIAYVARVSVKDVITVAINVGARFPAYATSMGRVLLAGQPDAWIRDYLSRVELRPFTQHTDIEPKKIAATLSDVRKKGFALTDRQLQEGLHSIAVPIHDRAGNIIAAINVTRPRQGLISGVLGSVLPELQLAARRIEEDLNSRQLSDQGPANREGADRSARRLV